ncbi:hypothetical protein [Bradyrhizobium sp. Ec3.3]|uniref:hypothetical protein n=1 Tax=Bradyrhizobium sp. Ec3.3 TaxID=189753 RepID=UPI00041E1BD3|nr:hypothetical protein [Bradyrhizobium sp. Ec3.3]
MRGALKMTGNSPMWLLWLAMFVLMTTLDFAWSKYSQATVARRAWAASGYAAAIYAVGALGIIGYTEHPSLIIPGCVGAFVGTFLATRRAH